MPVLLALLGCHTLDDVPLLAAAHCKPPEEHTVVRVLDGDTIQLDDCEGIEVRMLGVSAPEVVHDVPDACIPDPGAGVGEEDQCFGPEARAWLDDLLTGKQVRISYDETCTDRYGRTLAYVYLPGEDGDLFVNEAIVRQGYAEVYEAFDDILLADVLYSAQDAAQAERAGKWAVCE
jgi:micrococcal nuclease